MAVLCHGEIDASDVATSSKKTFYITVRLTYLMLLARKLSIHLVAVLCHGEIDASEVTSKKTLYITVIDASDVTVLVQ